MRHSHTLICHLASYSPFAFFCLRLFFGIEPFQWVTTDSPKKISPDLRPLTQSPLSRSCCVSTSDLCQIYRHTRRTIECVTTEDCTLKFCFRQDNVSVRDLQASVPLRGSSARVTPRETGILGCGLAGQEGHLSVRGRGEPVRLHSKDGGPT
jgi:hypothetical protein